MRRIFGFDPSRFYLLQLAIAAIDDRARLRRRAAVPGLETLACRRRAVRRSAPPLCSVVVQLSTVHYFLAIAFCALAVIAYAAALRRPSVAMDVISVLCYFLAMLAKEVAIPLPLLLIALPLRDTRANARFAS